MLSSARAEAEPRFSVIIPTYHRNESLAMCLDRLAPGCQTVAPEEYEVIVTDDGMMTTAEDMIRTRFPWVRWVPGPRRGPAANRNNGAAATRGEWLLFTDDDCLPTEGWIDSFSRHTRTGALALEGAVRPERPVQGFQDLCPVNETGGVFWTASVAVAASLFRQIGGFCEMFPYAANEDQDLHYRLQRHTHVPFVPDAAVIHPVVPQSLSRAVRRIGPGFYSYTVLALRHPNRLRRRNLWELLVGGTRVNGRVLLTALRRYDYFGMLMAFLYLTYGNALAIWYYQRLRGRISSVEATL